LTISKKLRVEVFKRDGFRCVYCGRTPPEIVLEVIRVEPVSIGEKEDINNLVTSCSDCTKGKDDSSNNNVIPIKINENLKIIKEKEEQIREYRKFIHKVEKRIQKDIDEIEKVFSDTYENTTFTEKFKRNTIRRFLEHLPLHEILDAMNIACSRIYDNPESTVKYFCGICWNKINGIKPEKQIPKIWKELSNYYSRGSGYYRPSDIELIKDLDQNSIKEVMAKALTGERQDSYWNHFMELIESHYN